MINEQSSRTTESDQEDSISVNDLVVRFKSWFRYLLSKWYIILTIVFICVSIGIVISLMDKPVYTAETTFVLEEDSGGGGMLGSLGGLAGIAGIDIGGGGGLFQGENIFHLYKSRRMIEKTLLSPMAGNSKKLLIDRYLEINKFNEATEKKPELKLINFARDSSFRLRDSLMTSFIKDINTNYLQVSKPDKKLSIIKVVVKSPDELFAKEFSDNIVENVNLFYVETKTKKSIQNVQILQRQTDSVRNVMNGAIYAAASTVDATPNLNSVRQVLRAPAQRSQFNAETNKAMLTELVKNLELSKMALRRETPLIQLVDTPVFPLKKDKFGKALAIIYGGLIGGFISLLVLIRPLINSFFVRK